MPHLRPSAVALLATTAIALTTAVVPGTSAAADDTGIVGSSTGPDPYFPQDGNGGYEVTHYEIDDRYRPGTDALEGRTTLTAVAGDQALSGFHLDLRLTPDAVTVDGRKATFSKPGGHELQVVPAAPVAAGETFTVTVRYHGTPSRLGSSTGWDPWFWRKGEVAAVGEPQAGPWWFAANETPGDKATFDITIRVPRGQQAVSNGRLVSRTVGEKWTSWRWRLSQPVATYLAFFVAGRYEIRRDRVDGRPLTYAASYGLDRAQRVRSFQMMGNTPRVLRWMEDRFGPYPYGSAGGVMSSVFTGFALETASRPFYSGGAAYGGVWLVVHELAHQWFGDTVGLRLWQDTWLNEGFATYAEWLWEEAHGGRTVNERLLDTWGNHPASSGFWQLRVSDPGPDQLFDTPVYDRGGMMLAALRCRLGVRPMRALVRDWVDQKRNGTATGQEFRDLASTRSGEDLTAFFAEWLDDTDRPLKSDPANGLGCA